MPFWRERRWRLLDHMGIHAEAFVKVTEGLLEPMDHPRRSAWSSVVHARHVMPPSALVFARNV